MKINSLSTYQNISINFKKNYILKPKTNCVSDNFEPRVAQKLKLHKMQLKSSKKSKTMGFF